MNTTAIVLIAAFAGIVIGFFLAFFCLGGLIAHRLGGFEAGVQQHLDHHEASVHTRLNGLEAKLSGGIEGVQDDLCRLLGRAASGSSSTSDLPTPAAAPVRVERAGPMRV